MIPILTFIHPGKNLGYLLMLIAVSLSHAGTTALFGTVKNGNTGKPVVDCLVKILPIDTDATTDSSGSFRLENLGAGRFRAVFIKPGFAIAENSNIVLKPGPAEELNELIFPDKSDNTLELPEKIVIGEADRPAVSDQAGAYRFGRNDVLRAPGALQDISLFAQTLPGVTRTDDQRTDLSVRGGSPNENAYLIDGIPIFNINHFETNNQVGGGIGNINTYFLEDVDLHTGAFSVRYPDRLSSVLEITFKRGNPFALSGIATLDAAGTGGLLEGPLPGFGGKATYGLSMRVSSLSMLDKLGLIDFGGVPKYQNAHLKMNFPVGKWEVSGNILGGRDGFNSSYLPVKNLRTTPDTAISVSQDIGRQYTDNLFVGARGTRLYERSRLSLYAAGNTRDFRNEKGNDFTLTKTGATPFTNNLLITEISGGNRALWGFDWDLFLNPDWTLRLGALEDYETPEYTYATIRTWGNGVLDSLNYTSAFAKDDYYDVGVYAEAENRHGPWSVTYGLRSLYDEYTGAAFLGPRLSVTRSFGNHALRASFGLHTQSQAEMRLANGIPEGKGELPFNAQSILAWDGDFPWGIDTRVELFDKEGFRMIRFRPDGSVRDTGRTASRGLDFYVRKSLRSRIWGSASYTYAWNRSNVNGQWVKNAYSVPHSFSSAVGYDFGSRFTASVHLAFASGEPYTPHPTPSSPLSRYSEVHDPYFRLDTRLEYRHPFAKASLGSFLEITNLTNHVNVFTQDEFEESRGWKFFPVGGFTVSF